MRAASDIVARIRAKHRRRSTCDREPTSDDIDDDDDDEEDERDDRQHECNAKRRSATMMVVQIIVVTILGMPVMRSLRPLELKRVRTANAPA